MVEASGSNGIASMMQTPDGLIDLRVSIRDVQGLTGRNFKVKVSVSKNDGKFHKVGSTQYNHVWDSPMDMPGSVRVSYFSDQEQTCVFELKAEKRCLVRAEAKVSEIVQGGA